MWGHHGGMEHTMNEKMMEMMSKEDMMKGAHHWKKESVN